MFIINTSSHRLVLAPQVLSDHPYIKQSSRFEEGVGWSFGCISASERLVHLQTLVLCKEILIRGGMAPWEAPVEHWVSKKNNQSQTVAVPVPNITKIYTPIEIKPSKSLSVSHGDMAPWISKANDLVSSGGLFGALQSEINECWEEWVNGYPFIGGNSDLGKLKGDGTVWDRVLELYGAVSQEEFERLVIQMHENELTQMVPFGSVAWQEKVLGFTGVKSWLDVGLHGAILFAQSKLVHKHFELWAQLVIEEYKEGDEVNWRPLKKLPIVGWAIDMYINTAGVGVTFQGRLTDTKGSTNIEEVREEMASSGIEPMLTTRLLFKNTDQSDGKPGESLEKMGVDKSIECPKQEFGLPSDRDEKVKIIGVRFDVFFCEVKLSDKTLVHLGWGELWFSFAEDAHYTYSMSILDRKEGPCYLNDNGQLLWMRGDALHGGADGVAYKRTGTYECVYAEEGVVSRTDGPAVIYENQDVEFWLNGELHNASGAALVYTEAKVGHIQSILPESVLPMVSDEQECAVFMLWATNGVVGTHWGVGWVSWPEGWNQTIGQVIRQDPYVGVPPLWVHPCGQAQMLGDTFKRAYIEGGAGVSDGPLIYGPKELGATNLWTVGWYLNGQEVVPTEHPMFEKLLLTSALNEVQDTDSLKESKESAVSGTPASDPKSAKAKDSGRL